MDFQKFVDGFKSMTCVISVEIRDDGSYGAIKIVAGNKAYIDSIEQETPDAPKMLTNKFIPNSDYQYYLPKDLNFENFCYRCAVLKEPMHSYVHPERFDFWFDIFMLPIDAGDEHIAYCTYTQELTQEPDTQKMSSISYETASVVLNTCLKLRGTNDFQKSMGDVLKDIREICDAKYGCILMIDFFTSKSSILCEALKNPDDESLYKENWVNDDFYKLVETWGKCIGGSNCLIIKNEKDLDFVRERNPEWYESLREADINSLLLFPLMSGCELLGYIWFSNYNTEDSVHLKETLELVSYFLASEISNYQLFDRLRIVSTMDMLTGVYNRNEMNDRVNQLSLDTNPNRKNIGVIFADLNGLKKVNDNSGHSAGDVLLKNAARILKESFPNAEIFRAGGDEFMVLVRDTTEAYLIEKAKEIKAKADATENVRFATGVYFDEDCNNIHNAMKIADGKMYEDKKQFYDKHPELRRPAERL